MRTGFSGFWKKLKLHTKIMTFAIVISAVVLITVLMDIWVFKIFLYDLRTNLELSERVGNVVQTLETESEVFTKAMREDDHESEELQRAIEDATEAVNALPKKYADVGDERYALMRATRESYDVYARRRDDFLNMTEGREGYLTELYTLYEMQDYLNGYASQLMIETSKAGNAVYRRILPQMLGVPVLMLGISILMIVGIIELTRAMNTSLVEPILQLAEASKKIANNDYSVPDLKTDTEDEMADLVQAFNKMKYATGEYIGALEEKRETLELLHAEELQKAAVENQMERIKFEALRNQMNPHFLFNTLNVIGGMAKLEDADLTEKMIKSLSNLFRYNLRTQETEIALEQDLKVVEDYLYLQKMRFGERIKWSMDYDPELGSYLVPTFMFQPFVENAIVHGLSPKVEGGMIHISITKENDKLVIVVADTGVGMEEDALQELLEKLEDTDEVRKGIGLGNIYRRLKLLYEDSEFRIQSTAGEGTSITVAIPAREYVM